MSDHQVVDELVDLIGQQEPPLSIDAGALIGRGRRLRRARRIRAGVAGGLVVAILAAMGPLLDLGPWHSGTAESAAAPAEHLPPDELESALLRAGSNLSGTAWQDGGAEALDAVGQPIEGPDRDKATRWKATFETATSESFEIRLLHHKAGLKDGVGLKEDCSRMLDAGHALTCTAEPDGRGGTVQHVVRWVAFRAQTWVWLTPEEAGRARNVWLEQTVRGYRETGEATVAIRRVADTGQPWRAQVESGQAQEALTRLEAVVADDSLTFPPAPIDSCGGWMVEQEGERRGCP